MTISTNSAPYFNDSVNAIENNYMEILFKPGYAVQSRELTQIQTILQNQISQLSGFVFQDGSPVYGGHISFDGTVTALSLQQQYANTDISLSDFLVGGNNTLIVNASGPVTVKAYVVAVDSTQNNPIILVKYLTGTTFKDGDTIQVTTGLQSQAQLISSNSSSPASVVSISNGIFFSGGYFVTVPASTIALSSSNNAPSYRVGLSINETIIDSVTDTTLLDPAQGSFNYQAPGADRYQYSLYLDYRSFDSTDDSAFYDLLHLQNGLVTSQVEYPIFGALNDTLAQRTYDQSGDFTVSPFTIATDVNQANSNQYTIVVSPGKAYVKGYEFETVGTQRLYADKALTTNSITDYTISMEYGNILIANNMHGGNISGMFNIAGYQAVDLHLLPSGQLVTANAGSYNATLIGTSMIRDIEFLGLGDYYVYVVGTNLVSNTFQAATGNSISVTLPGIYSSVANCYANVYVTVNTGGIVDSRIITNYTTGRVAFLNNPLTTPATSSSNVTLNYALRDLNSMVINPGTGSYAANIFATQNAASAEFACMDIAAAGQDVTGNTILSDTQFNKMIFALPQSYVAQNTITNASYYVRNSFLNQSFSNTSLTINLGGSETFPYGLTGGYLSDIRANANFIVVVRNSLSSNLSNGQVLVMNRNSVPGGNGIYQFNQTQVIINTSANSAFYGDVYYTALQSSATLNTRRSKTLVGNSAMTALRASDVYTNGNAVVGLANVNTTWIDAANGIVWFQSYYDQALTPGASQSLYIPDVFNVIAVLDSGAPNVAPNASSTNITTNYYLNSGQNDNFYDFSSLILRNGANPPAGQTAVILPYFAHNSGSVQGFFDADSYSANVYSQGLIPYYSSPTFGTFSLRDSIDFRPTRALGSLADIRSYTLQGLQLPQPDNTMVLSYQYYLPRIDKLMLTKTGLFQVKQGTPSQYPITPSDSDDAMTLYILNVPAYTANVKSIALQYVENKRYTMKDIGTLDNRITNLEYLSVLSGLEARAASQKILYQDGVTTKDQYGIIADDFSNFSIADNQSTDLRAYMQSGTLSPFKDEKPLGLVFVGNTQPFALNDKTYSLPFNETPAIQQNTATEAVSIQPYLFGQFTGTCKLTPETDYWFSTQLAPQIIAPPTSSVALPPLPVPVSASALVPANTSAIAPGAPLIASSQSTIGNFWLNQLKYYADYANAPINISVSYTSYGVLSVTRNWFGELTSSAQTASVYSTTSDNYGSPIQLQPGTSVNNSTTLVTNALQVL